MYRISIQEPPRLRRWMRALLTFSIGAATAGAGAVNPGGRRVLVLDAATRSRVTEAFGDEQPTLVTTITRDLDELSAAAFAQRWIEGTRPDQPDA